MLLYPLEFHFWNQSITVPFFKNTQFHNRQSDSDPVALCDFLIFFDAENIMFPTFLFTRVATRNESLFESDSLSGWGGRRRVYYMLLVYIVYQLLCVVFILNNLILYLRFLRGLYKLWSDEEQNALNVEHIPLYSPDAFPFFFVLSGFYILFTF